MGLFGSSKSGSAQKWAKPYAIAGANDIRAVQQQTAPQLQEITKGVTDLLPGIGSTYSSWGGNMDASKGYYGDVLGGKYLDVTSNPFLKSILGQTTRDVTNNVNAQFSQAGRYGSGAHTDILSRNLAEAENSLYGDQYNRERAAMDSAAGAVPQIQSSILSQLLQGSQLGAELPWTGVNNQASGLSALFSGSSQNKGIGGVLQGIAKAGATAAAAGAFSDSRLKHTIVKLGELADGLGVYEWTYIWGGPRQTGVMADEVKVLRPWALGPEIAGFMTVNYGVL